jgi:hypothetical protein
LSNPEEIRLDIVELSEEAGNDKADRLTAARQKTASLFSTWRSRFSTGSVKDNYSLPAGEVLIDSQAADKVRVTHTSDIGEEKVYDLDLTNGTVDLKVTSPPTEPQTTESLEEIELQNHEKMAQILFDCDRVEMRGRGIPD